MWEKIFGYIPRGGIWVCAMLSVVIPLTIYFINKKLHEMGDPPWKKNNDEKQKQD
jgi:hypothetical protein